MFSELVEELVDLTDAELDEFVRSQELARREAEAKLAAAIAVAESRALYEADGHRTTKQYLKATCNWAGGEAVQFRAAARLVDAHPDVGDGWLAGRFGLSQVHALAKVRSRRAARERFAEFLPTFVEQAEQLRFDDFEIVLERFLFLGDADGRFDERAAIERRSATVVDVQGELHVSASGGDSLSTAEMVEIMRRFEHAEFKKDIAARDAAVAEGREPESFRSGPQRRFDALLTIFRLAGQHADSAVTGTTPLVSILVDERTVSWILAHSGIGALENLAGLSVDPFTGLPLAPGALDDLLGDPSTFLERRCETESGLPLRPTDVLRAMLSGEIRRVVLGAKGRIIDLGRSSRVFTGAAREAALLLTRTCAHPGCDMPASWCQVDHSTEWSELGRTDQDNAEGECGHHNRDKHRKRRRTKRAVNGRVITFRSDGSIMLPVGCRPPRFDDDPDDVDDDLEPQFTPEQEQTLIEAARARAALLVADR